MGKFTTLAISQDDHLKLKIISAKLKIPMMKLLHQWIEVGCIIVGSPAAEPTPAEVAPIPNFKSTEE